MLSKCKSLFCFLNFTSYSYICSVTCSLLVSIKPQYPSEKIFRNLNFPSPRQTKQSESEQQKFHLIEYQQLLQDLECWVTETYSQITADVCLGSVTAIREQITLNQVKEGKHCIYRFKEYQRGKKWSLPV